MASSRRGFLAGAAASVAAPALARTQTAVAAPASIQVRQRIVRRGRAIAIAAHGGPIVVAHDARRTIAIVTRGQEKIVDVGGQPLAVAVSPDARAAAVMTAAWDKPGLVIVDLVTGDVRTRVDVGPAPFDVAFTPDGRRILVSGGEQEGQVVVVDARRLVVTASAPVGTVPRGLAMAPRGGTAWVALNGDDRVARVDTRTGRVRRELRTPQLPDRVAVSPDGRRLLVSHGGRNDELVSEIEIASGNVTHRQAGRLPSAVGWTRGGRGVVALGGTGEIVVLARRGARTARHRTGGSPRGLALAGSRAYTVDALAGEIAKVRL